MGFHKHVSAKERHQIFFSFLFYFVSLSSLGFSIRDDRRPTRDEDSLREKSDRNPRGTKTLSVVAAAPPCSLVFSLRTTIETDKGSDSVGNSRRLLRYLVFTVRRGQHDLDADYLNEVGIAFTFSVFIGYDWI